MLWAPSDAASSSSRRSRASSIDASSRLRPKARPRNRGATSGPISVAPSATTIPPNATASPSSSITRSVSAGR